MEIIEKLKNFLIQKPKKVISSHNIVKSDILDLIDKIEVSENTVTVSLNKNLIIKTKNLGLEASELLVQKGEFILLNPDLSKPIITSVDGNSKIESWQIC